MTDITQYAHALFSLATESGREDKIGEELSLLSTLIKENPKYSSLLDTPALSLSERASLIDEALSSLDEYVRNTFKLLAEARLTYTLPKLSDIYGELLDEKRGVLRAEAISAIPMTESQTEALKAKLQKETGKTVVIKNTVDASILGGLILRYGGLSEDGSLKNRLEKIKKTLFETKL